MGGLLMRSLQLTLQLGNLLFVTLASYTGGLTTHCAGGVTTHRAGALATLGADHFRLSPFVATISLGNRAELRARTSRSALAIRAAFASLAHTILAAGTNSGLALLADGALLQWIYPVKPFCTDLAFVRVLIADAHFANSLFANLLFANLRAVLGASDGR